MGDPAVKAFLTQFCNNGTTHKNQDWIDGCRAETQKILTKGNDPKFREQEENKIAAYGNSYANGNTTSGGRLYAAVMYSYGFLQKNYEQFLSDRKVKAFVASNKTPKPVPKATLSISSTPPLEPKSPVVYGGSAAIFEVYTKYDCVNSNSADKTQVHMNRSENVLNFAYEKADVNFGTGHSEATVPSSVVTDKMTLKPVYLTMEQNGQKITVPAYDAENIPANDLGAGVGGCLQKNGYTRYVLSIDGQQKIYYIETSRLAGYRYQDGGFVKAE